MKTDLGSNNMKEVTNLRVKNERISRKLNEMINNGLADKSYHIDPKSFRRFHDSDT